MYQDQFCSGILKVCDLVFILPPILFNAHKNGCESSELVRQHGGVEDAGSKEEWVLASGLQLVSHVPVGKFLISLIIIFLSIKHIMLVLNALLSNESMVLGTDLST